MINVNVCQDYLKSLMKEIYYSQIDNLNKAADLLTKVVNHKGKIFFFGQGHSVWVGKDVKGSYNLPLEVIEEENCEAVELLNKYEVNKNDVVIITSNSGINAYVVDLAIAIKKADINLIVINSYKHTFVSKSRHHSNTKLYQYGDVVIDNCCVYGDAAIKDEENYLGSFSSIANNVIVHTILNKVIKKSS